LSFLLKFTLVADLFHRWRLCSRGRMQSLRNGQSIRWLDEILGFISKMVSGGNDLHQ